MQVKSFAIWANAEKEQVPALVQSTIKWANDNNLKSFIELLEILKKPYALQENISDYLKMGISSKEYKTFCGT